MSFFQMAGLTYFLKVDLKRFTEIENEKFETTNK